MNYRDEQIWRRLSKFDSLRITSHELAEEFNCHHNTARNSLKRIKQAGYIDLENCRRGGYVITVKVKA